jgi:hypothetical protein
MDKNKSYLDKGPMIILGLILTFILLIFTAKDELRANILSTANLLYADTDKDGIENYMDPCINNPNSRSDSDNNGCPDTEGFLKKTISDLDQINPICKTKSCISIMRDIENTKNLLKSIDQPAYWTNKGDINCQKNDTYPKAVQAISTLKNTCKKNQNTCQKINESIATSLNQLQKIRTNHKNLCK